MHAMVLGFAGYSLLLSSCMALILLSRIGCIKDILKSPLHIFSTSDTLISVITSIILLINQSKPTINFEKVLPIAGDNKIEDRQLVQNWNNEMYYQNQTCVRFYHKYNDSWPDNEDMNGTTTNCTFQHVLMHYAMFLVPFANAFMSLLIYSVQCSSRMSCVIKKCYNITRVSQSRTDNLQIGNSTEYPAHAVPHLSFRKRDSDAQEDLTIISKDPGVDVKTRETILTITDDGNISTGSNNNPKFTGFGLITQWLVPVLVTATLYFSKVQDMNKLRGSNDMECIFKVNFPLESCSLLGHEGDLTNTEFSRNPLENYSELTVEMEDPDTFRISHPDSKAIDEVVSSVRNVVQLALNKICDNSTELKYYNSSQPWNITKYLTINNLTQQLTSDEKDMFEKLTEMQQALNNKDQGIWRNKECTTTNEEESVKTDEKTFGDNELKFFENLIESTRIKTTLIQETNPEVLFPQTVTMETINTTDRGVQKVRINNTSNRMSGQYQSEIALNKTRTENEIIMMKAKNVTQNMNDKVYTDIIEQIRNTVTQVKVTGQTGNSDDKYEANNNESRISEPEIHLLELDSGKIRKDRKNFFVENTGERFSRLSLHMDAHCFMSTKFLKIHLLILLFSIYFIPVLVSGILQTRAIYMCKNVFEKLETDGKNISAISQTTDLNKINVNENPPPKPGWFFSKSEDTIETDLANSENIEHLNPSNSAQSIARIGDKDGKDYLQIEKQRTWYKSVLHETRSMQMLFSILTKSLMLGILMWTPAFLEILSKVFLCSSTPPWLMNLLFLIGISFGIVKNFLNVNIAKINKSINDQISGKENSIHPSD